MNAAAPFPDLRGDYSGIGDDCTVPQRHDALTAADHATWRTLHARQSELFPAHAAIAYREGVARLDCAAGVPDLQRASERLAGTGWRLVAVPGLIPEEAFFAHLAARRFPVTHWLRRPEEMDYLQEPDIFHDFLGHVPLLTDPDFAAFLEGYGRMGAFAARHGAVRMLARLYWHMVEFGLIAEAGGVRAYGAGILSSAKETVWATTSAPRLRFDAARVLCTEYEIDRLQPLYFTISGYGELFATLDTLPRLLLAARDAPAIAPGVILPTDIRLN
ncbi:MAG TPA: phenylalanine 4-monooxygenase [Roseococcus sp.]|nr:phenylalanine 4-monooxygenase [Roseococcus sp.]